MIEPKTISDLIGAIRAWQAAREAHENREPHQGGTWHAVQYAAKVVTGSFLQSDELLPQFVALADAYEAQAAALRAIADAPDSSDAYAELLKRMALEALTGNDEGDA